MGAVYLAHDDGLDRLVALKVPNFNMGSDSGMIERFHREARVAAAFHHPNFCPIYDVGQVGEMHYLAMAYIEGETLRKKLDGGPAMPLHEAARIVFQLASAMAEAHRRGIIHRDLKPLNVMVDPQGSLVIMDFGLARRTGAGDAEVTQTGMPMGTPHYMSPEQVRGDRHEVGPPTDVYSLGVILYELVAGRRPFEGSASMVYCSVLKDKPPSLSSIRPGLDKGIEAVCQKAMAKKIEDRYPSMEALAADLGAYLRTPEPVLRPPSGRRRRAVLGSVVGTALLALMGWAAYVATDKGTLKVEGFADGMEIRVDGQEIPVEKAGEPIAIRVGQHGLLVTRGDVIVHSPRSFEVERGKETVIALDSVGTGPTPPVPEPPKVAEVKRLPEIRPAPEPKKVAEVKPATPPLPPPPPPPAPEPKKVEPTAREAAIAAKERGNDWFGKKEYDKALDEYEESIRLDPTYANAYNNRGNLRKNKGEIDRAVDDYDRAIRLDPGLAAAYYNRGNIHGDRGESDKAFADLSETIRLDPKHSLARVFRGNIWEERKDYAKAMADYDEALRIDPKNTIAYFHRALAEQGRGRLEAALADLDEAIRLDPKYTAAFNSRGKTWSDKGEPIKAFADFDEAIRLDPKNALAFSNRGKIWTDRGDLDKAIADYDEAIRLDPKNALAYSNRGYIWQIRDNFDKALADYEEAIRFNPKLAIAYNNRGFIRTSRGDLDKGLADYDEAIKLNPSFAIAFVNRGNFWSNNRKDLIRAMADYDEALRIDPKYAYAYNSRGNLWATRGDLDKALSDFDEAIRFNPKYALAYANRGDIRGSKKEFVKAMADYDEALRIDSKFTYVYNSRGNLWSAKGDLDKALSDFDEAIRLNPKYYLAYFNRGNTWATRKDYPKALADFGEVIRISPTYANAFNNRGVVRNNTKEYDKAIVDFDEVLRLDPRSAKAHNNRGFSWQSKAEIAKARADYEAAIRIEPRNLNASGNLAWLLAACPDAATRDGKRAVELAARACEVTAWKNDYYLDILAVSLAEAGDFDAAVRREEQAIALAPEPQKAQYRLRLKLFQEKQPIRDPSLKPKSTVAPTPKTVNPGP